MSDPIDDALAAHADGSDSDTIDSALAAHADGSEPSEAPKGPAYRQSSKGPGGDLLLHMATSMGSSAVAGAHEVYDLARGKSVADADLWGQNFIREHTYTPQDQENQRAQGAFESRLNPLNWPHMLNEKVGDTLTEQTGSPVAGATTMGALDLGEALFGGKVSHGEPVPTRGFAAPKTAAARVEPTIGEPATVGAAPDGAPLSASGSARPSYFEPKDIPEKPGTPVDTPPVEGGLPQSANSERAAILQRVGVENARDSALEGNAKNAATDFQMSRFDEPAGVEAKNQFIAERAALDKHAQGIVADTGGTLGTDEDSLNIRGQTIAKPFDSLRKWFEDKTDQLYQEADKRAGGQPVTQLDGVDQLLQNKQFRNTLLAKDQGSLLNAMESQLREFKENNPGGFNVKGAEEVRQWLNQIWSNDNKYAVGKVKEALDNDVLKGAGEDIYGEARKLVAQKHATLDNPKGVATLMDADPTTPLNRTTPYVKVPDTLTRMDPEQFGNVLKTLKGMPPEIQGEAQAAINEIKAHLANKIYDAGSSTQNQWNAPGVSKVISANKSKIQQIFSSQEQQKISDLDSAGKILRVDQTYPGAAAQAANAMKRGLMSRALGKVGATAGAAAGSVLGPLGAAGGAALGEAGGGALGASMSERAAVKRWQSKVTKLSDLANP